MAFLISNKEDFENSEIEQFDFILVSGDAYVDHPSFGVAIIGRTLENEGYSVGIIPQPDWNDINSFKIYGEPRLGFLVTGGNIDSMVNHYSVSKNKRKKDLYSPNGEAGHRPDRATIVYGNKIREAYKNSPIIIGGIEASLRRLSHYDYWDNRIRRSILLDSSADLLIFGMAENQIVEVADAIASGIPVEDITYIRGTVYKTKDPEKFNSSKYIELPTFKECNKDKLKYNESFKLQNDNAEFGIGKILVESYGNVLVVQNPPARPLTTSEFDKAYNLKYERNYHPMYEEMGGVPAITEVKFSIINNRGCFGSCNFCALTFHQGRVVQTRSHKSVINEAKKITYDKDFKGYIHDVGGPTANFSGPACDKQEKYGACPEKKCLSPTPCKSLKIDHTEYLDLLRELRELPNIKKVFVRSGIRYDYLIYDKDTTFFDELCEHHVSGQLKVAPEHISDNVLKHMGKPSEEVYNKFVNKFYQINDKLGKKQFIVPYLMSSHPGSDINEAIKLAQYLKKHNVNPEQVQDFYPTPGTLSTCIYYTGIDPYTNEEVYVPKTKEEKAMQRALIQFKLPQNYNLVKKALEKADRDDLIGFDDDCLIRPRNFNNSYKSSGQSSNSGRSSDKKKSSSSGKSPNHGKPAYQGKGKPKAKSRPSSNNAGKPGRKKKTIRNVHKKK